MDRDQAKESWLRVWVKKSYGIPMVGRILRIASAIWNLPTIMQNITEYRDSVETRLAGAADRTTAEELRSLISDKADRGSVEELRSSLAGKADRETVGELRRIVNGAGGEGSAEDTSILDAMYLSFEERFRGSPAEIKRKLQVYLPIIDSVASAKMDKDDTRILDVGCGRGDWLDLLRETGYRAQGIDRNEIAVRHCRQRGLDVAMADVIEFLKEVEGDSLDVITGFHLIEHLPFRVLISLFDESLAALRSGGVIILETPNPTNILVSAYDFYRDPGHLRPLHPDTIDFIAGNRGFVRTGAYFVSGDGSDLRLVKSTHWKLDDIRDYLGAPRDFVLIGYKP